MNGIMIVLTLLSGVALFLYGMSLMGDGLKRVAGNQLELVLYKLTNTPIKGVLLGTIVTAIIQSSSATTVMVVGFVNSGMMKVAQAIGIIMGANIGTSVTGWILCLSYIDGSSGIAQLLSTATISAENVTLPTDKTLKVTVNGPFTATLDGYNDVTASYKIKNGNDELTTDSAVLTAQSGETAKTTTLTFVKPDAAPYAGSYTGTVTFTVSVN